MQIQIDEVEPGSRNKIKKTEIENAGRHVGAGRPCSEYWRAIVRAIVDFPVPGMPLS